MWTHEVGLRRLCVLPIASWSAYSDGFGMVFAAFVVAIRNGTAKALLTLVCWFLALVVIGFVCVVVGCIVDFC